MSFTNFANKVGVPVSTMVGYPGYVNSFTPITMDATGKSIGFIGRIFIEGGTGTKTISSAGGKIVWATGAVTAFANAGTNIRVGINDVGAVGVEDGTHDVYADLVGGVASLPANTVQTISMVTGSKSITHGDLIAVVIEMTARGGADSVQGMVANDSNYFPHSTFDTGSGPVKSGVAPCCHIVFDDGSYGWFPNFYGCRIEDTTAFNTGTNPDEIALVFQLPFASEITELFTYIGAIATTDDFEMVLYSTPSTSPTVIETVSFTGYNIGSTASAPDSITRALLATPRTLLANTEYAIAVRPTTANSITIRGINFGSANSAFRKMTTLGTNWYWGERQNQSGAFSAVTYKLPYMGFNFRSIENISGGSSVFA